MNMHQFCKRCKNIMTSDEMNKHFEDFLGLCDRCREKLHVDTFKKRFEDLQKEEKDGPIEELS